jgi:OmpA-OmpF porin, OOP family
MYRAVFPMLCLAVFAAFFPSSALAQNRSNALTFSLMKGVYKFEGNQGLKDDTVLGLAIGYNFTESFAAEGALTMVETTASQNPKVDVRGYGARLDLLYHFRTQQHFVPFLALGVGGVSYEPKDGESDKNLLVGYGVGAKYYLTENLALRADVRHLYHVNDSNQSRSGYNNLLLSAGLHFQMGGARSLRPPSKAELPPAPTSLRAELKEDPPPEIIVTTSVLLDNDGDGVPDHLDRCPNTPWGEVDQHGCPRDDDGDGVPNYLDRCPDTPPGLTVDAWGCLEPLRLDVTFLPNDAIIDPRHHAEITAIAETLRRAPAGSIILIEGHTDSIGSEKGNLRLSQKRAEAVRNYLIQLDLSPALLVAKGLGGTVPIADNSSQTGRAQNRRVTIQLLSEK